jgi:uncharacterized membrane protein
MEKKAELKTLHRLLSAVLVLALLGAAAALIYHITSPPAEKFTEFYILNAEGIAGDYPNQLDAGEEANLILGIINREQTTVTYRVDINIEGQTINILGPLTLGDGEKLEQPVTFTPDKPGENQKVEFLLYKQGQSDVLESLYLLVNVRE